MLMSIRNLCCNILTAPGKIKSFALLALLAGFFFIASGDPHFEGDYSVIIRKNGFCIAYSPEIRQAGCTCYILTSSQVKAKKVRRTNKFMHDPDVSVDAVRPEEYNGTGFDRGHLVPASDMSYSYSSMRDSFYMSNISPQVPACNRGIWKKLESQIRKWAVKEKKIMIITGPVIPSDRKQMNDTRIVIPSAFFKIVYDTTAPRKMIGFIIPNQGSRKSLKEFAVPVREIEKVTGYNFFATKEFEKVAHLETHINCDDWDFDTPAVYRKKGKKRKSKSTSGAFSERVK